MRTVVILWLMEFIGVAIALATGNWIVGVLIAIIMAYQVKLNDIRRELNKRPRRNIL